MSPIPGPVPASSHSTSSAPQTSWINSKYLPVRTQHPRRALIGQQPGQQGVNGGVLGEQLVVLNGQSPLSGQRLNGLPATLRRT